jgi:hypothetical protein
MFDVTCPFCYHRTNRLRPWFECSGIAAPGYSMCPKRPDPDRQRETGNDEPMYPVFPPPWLWLPSPRRARCPDCNGRTGQRVCAECHSPLPANFGGSFSPVIAVVGARSTGKTVYLIVVAHHLRTVVRDRFRSTVSLFPDEAYRTHQANVEAIFEKGSLPALTEQRDGRSEPLVFEWRRRRISSRIFRRYHSTYLSFLDTAGESLGTRTGVQELKFLAGVDAFIVVLDPFTLPGARDRLSLPKGAPTAESNAYEVLSQVTEVIRKAEGTGRGARIKKPIAVAFAKIDALKGVLGDGHAIFGAEATDPWLDDASGRAVDASVREMLIDLGAGNIEDHMQSNYSNYRYFAVSSLGRPPDYEHYAVAEGGVQPLRVADPVVWLLGVYKLVPRRRGRG